jgi:ERCC4-type nuclease
MIIEIDNREPQIVKEYFINLSKNNDNFIYKLKNLEQGDYIIRDKNDNILLIFERKTINDLLSSVKDSRYTEQCIRFSELDISSHKIIYIIEGDYNIYNKDSVEYKTIYSCIYSLNYNREFSLLFTNSMNNTITIIDEFLMRLFENKVVSNHKFNLVKKQTITKENINNYMLNLVPGVGLQTAKEILLNYDNKLYILIEKLKEDQNILNNIKIKNRKISSKIITNIKEYLL